MGKHKFAIDGRQFEVEVGTRRGTTVAVTVNGKDYSVELASESSAMALRATPSVPAPVTTSAFSAAPSTAPPAGAASAGGAGAVTAPMAGLVLKVEVKQGDQVAEGDVLVVLEAMKMENAITANVAGTVTQVAVQAQQTVNQGDLLVDIG